MGKREIKEIRIDGQDSDWYTTAQFILKPHITERELPNDLLDSAEQIIEKHLKLYPLNRTYKGKSQIQAFNMNTINQVQTKADTMVNRFVGMSIVMIIASIIFYIMY